MRDQRLSTSNAEQGTPAETKVPDVPAAELQPDEPSPGGAPVPKEATEPQGQHSPGVAAAMPNEISSADAAGTPQATLGIRGIFSTRAAVQQRNMPKTCIGSSEAVFPNVMYGRL